MKLQEVILRNYRGFRISLQYIIAAREYDKKLKWWILCSDRCEGLNVNRWQGWATMTNLKEQFYQTKNIEFLKKTLGRELWVQVSGSKDINGASAAFWAALMPVENIDEAYQRLFLEQLYRNTMPRLYRIRGQNNIWGKSPEFWFMLEYSTV